LFESGRNHEKVRKKKKKGFFEFGRKQKRRKKVLCEEKRKSPLRRGRKEKNKRRRVGFLRSKGGKKETGQKKGKKKRFSDSHPIKGGIKGWPTTERDRGNYFFGGGKGVFIVAELITCVSERENQRGKKKMDLHCKGGNSGIMGGRGANEKEKRVASARQQDDQEDQALMGGKISKKRNAAVVEKNTEIKQAFPTRARRVE